MAASGAAGASTSSVAPPPSSTLARTSPPPSTVARTSPPPSTVARTSPPPSTVDTTVDASRISLQVGADDGGGDDPLMRTDAGGGKRPQTSQTPAAGRELDPLSLRKKPNKSSHVPSILKEKEKNQKVVEANDKIEKKNQKVVKANDKIEKEKNQKVVKANDKIEKEKNQKMVKANDKIEKKMLPLKPGTASDGGRLENKYPTSHLYFYQLWSIKKLLNREESILNRKIVKKDATGQDMTVAQMISEMQAKFNQYWKETYMSACIPVIFDPRYKYDLLEYLLSDFGTEKEAETWMDEVKKNMQELFNEYKKEFGEGETHRETDTDEVQDVDDPLADAGWDQYVKSRRRQSNNELELYLKEQLTPRKEEVDILHWWKTKSETYPVLSAIARDVLAISASTVPSESAFSTGGRVISDYRSSLKPTTVEALMCLHDWFKAADARKNEE